VDVASVRGSHARACDALGSAERDCRPGRSRVPHWKRRASLVGARVSGRAALAWSRARNVNSWGKWRRLTPGRLLSLARAADQTRLTPRKQSAKDPRGPKRGSRSDGHSFLSSWYPAFASTSRSHPAVASVQSVRPSPMISTQPDLQGPASVRDGSPVDFATRLTAEPTHPFVLARPPGRSSMPGRS
jgi:hypothetical protein